MRGCAIIETGTVIDRDQPVRVFKNLKHGCYSIMQRGVVRASARVVRLADVEFRVGEKGRQKIHVHSMSRQVNGCWGREAEELVGDQGYVISTRLRR